ncbi:MAG: 1-(5-phosphoribosyl)-5-[(5-phosphoribosylamino)methylideneamino]imidazole-4-carboxamide isomerase [Clostridia bacterium]|nr:1-(5-phosphoribosyl)-5-[(5-phosphoribosylamino)methylideneamino]imidazole-4-carboxamide isomerase [Clostridia bacterium]
MEIYPAIDIRGGKVVRLTNGDYGREEVYSSSPESIAEEFAACGAKNLHIVDLDGAREGTLANADVIKRIAKTSGLFIEVGGGIRSLTRMEEYINAGAGRVILGSAAVDNFTLVTDAVKFFGGKAAVGVDACGGKVAIHGWRTVTDTDAFAFCRRLKESGVRTVIFTDISTDGALNGTNMRAFEELKKIGGINIIASGGITYYEELEELRKLGVYGAVLGKALYTGKLDLKRVIRENGESYAC